MTRARAVLATFVLLVAAGAPALAQDPAQVAMQRAMEEFRRGNHGKSFSILEKYLEENPEDGKRGQVRLELAQLYHQDGKSDEARTLYKKIIDEDPDAAPQAGWQFLSLMECNFYLWSDRTWGPGDSPRVGVNVWMRDGAAHPEKIACEVYKLDADKLEAEWREKPLPLETVLVSPPKGAATKVASWEIDWPKNGGGEPIKIDGVKGTGIYAFVARPFGVPFRMPIVVASHALVVKRGSAGALVFAADRGTGAPIAGLPVYATDRRGKKGKAEPIGETGKDGCWEGKLDGNGEICAWRDGSLAASHSWWWGYGSGALVTHFSTDRPIYRPGHTVHWKAIVRALGPSGDYALPEKGKTVKLVVRDPNGAEVWKGEATPDAYGTFTGDVELKEGCPLGMWSIDLGTGSWAQFRVEEYRKPEYQVKVEAPASVVQGDTVTARIKANYYFGAPVTKAQVTWQVFRRPHWRPWWTLFPCRDCWFFEDEANPWGWGYGQGTLVKQGNGELDKDGTLSISYEVTRQEDANEHQDEVVTVLAHVQDESRRDESGSAEVLAPRASFSLYAQVDRWVYRPGDEIGLQVRALDSENKPRADVAVTGKAEVREWKDGKWTATRSVGEVSGTTNAEGNATLRFSPDARGSLVVTLSAKDEKGREVHANASVWLADEMWASPPRANMECVADKRSYDVGDTATVLCTMPGDTGTALVTREREGIASHSVERWEKGVLFLKMPVDASCVPNVYVTVTAVAGQLHQGQAEIAVLPEKRLLDVTVTFDKTTYQPREKAVVKVKAVERASKTPVRCQVALGIADASLYALAADTSPDIRKFFYKRRPHTVQTQSSFEWWVTGQAGANGALAEASKAQAAPAPPGAQRAAAKDELAADKKGGEQLVEAEVRKDFPDTWAWRGALETDANGEATVELTTPDSLTTWRATARAVTAETAVGSATAEATVFLPVLVRLEPPRFLVQGDAGGVSALVHNYLEKGKKTKISWKATGPVDLGKATFTGGELVEQGDGFAWVAIPSRGEVRIDWFEARAEKPGKVQLEVTAQTDEASDAMRSPPFPVLAHGAPRFFSWAGALDEKESETIELALPEGGIPEALSLDLSITPSVAATVLDSLESLAGYPYGCVEQTMSRFLPDVVALDTLRKLSQDEPKLRAELPKMIDAGIDRLRGFQHPDGGWGWWEHDETHPYMTAYVVYGLALARQADVKVDDAMFNRGVAALEQLLRGKAKLAHAEDKEDPNARAYMLFALSQAKKAPAKQLAKLFESRADLNVYGKAVLARTLWKSGQKTDAATVAKELASSATTTGSTCFWTVDVANHGWTGLDTETTAQALHALEETGEAKELWPKTVKWLVVHRRGHWWYSTRDTAMIVYVLCEHMTLTNELDADEDLSISVGDRELAKEHVDRTNVLSGRIGLKLGWGDLKGAKTITFKRSGKGLGYYAANLRTTAFEEDMKPSPGPITCERSIEVFRREKDGSGKKFALGKEPLQVGDELHVSLHVQAAEAREYVLIEDPIPAGCEFVRDDLKGENHNGGRGYSPWSWWYCHREYRDDRLAVCSTYVWANHDYRIDYVLRCERPGDYHVLPTRAIDMYNPDVGGTGAENRVSIR